MMDSRDTRNKLTNVYMYILSTPDDMCWRHMLSYRQLYVRKQRVLNQYAPGYSPISALFWCIGFILVHWVNTYTMG